MSGISSVNVRSEPQASLELAILRSVLYAALFDYPLTLGQLRRTLLQATDEEDAIVRCYRSSAFLRQRIEYRDGYFLPRGRGDLIDERRRREASSRALLDRNRWLLKMIGSVPYTRLVALSGSAAHLNIDGEGDLDLFVLTRGNRVWSVTVTILLLAKLVRRRRIVCANYVLSDEHLHVDPQDLFSANQIIHLRPLVGGDLYRQFVEANAFVARFYPNFTASGVEPADYGPGRLLRAVKRTLEALGRPGPSQLYEALCQALYARYLRRQSGSWRSPDQVRLQSDCLKLHTQSHRHRIRKRFEEAVVQALARVPAGSS